MKNGFLIFMFYIIPKAFFSRIFGCFARTRLSKLIMMNWFITRFNINKEEMEVPSGGFKTMDQFFTRRLKNGVHKIDPNKLSVVSPVDARIDEFGPVTGTRVMQAKDIDYLLAELMPSQMHHYFIDGSFVTLYLSPADYHRIHSPVDGIINGFLYVPGKLFPVAQFMVNGIKRLFCLNERVVTFIKTPFGICAVCKIGAMNVGRISLSYDDTISNKSFFRGKKEFHYPNGLQPITHRGDELGTFHLGSTVVLLFEKDMVEFDRMKEGQRLRVGQKFGTLTKKNK